jgi:DNA-directed RNA polymerase specialized sigma24 family protein
VQLRHIDELTNPQIAEIMELSVEAVESLTARGKRKLTKILQSHKSELGYNHG